MGKQKDFRHVHHSSHKKKDKKVDKVSKPSRSSCHEGFLKSIEIIVETELEAIASAKKIGRKMRKELERYPLLAKAVFLGCERAVDSILEAGENVNIQIQDGSTPLIIAVENGHPGIVQKLLKKGADPKLLRQDGRNALMVAVSKNDNRSFMLIWTYWDKSNFCELNHSDSEGYTVLTIAAKHGHSQFTNFLLSISGVEVDKQTKDGKTPLMFAVTAGLTNMVQKLLSSGSDFALEDKNGATAVCLAISENRADVTELLLECFDSKSRDIYVKKRIELLSRPRIDDNASITSFYKDILFRVILEVRKSFEDGIALLEKYQMFSGLLKCMDTYQHDTELLQIGFHLAVCIMYDKAEYSRYICEELAEEYITAKFADFSLKVMRNYRLKSMSDIRGAAFLSIHAGSQCRSGKTWLKKNYFQVLPFVKEFKVMLPTLTFWADGENIKAKIIFDRFLEILDCVEKEVKHTIPESEAKAIMPDLNAVPGSLEKDSKVSTSEASMTSITSDNQQWFLVSNSKSGSSKSSAKASNKQTTISAARKKDGKRKSKGSKLQTKLQRKISEKKRAQRPNLKYVPGLSASFPALCPEVSFSQTGYADALKKNLKAEELLYEREGEKTSVIAKDVTDSGSNKRAWTDMSAWYTDTIQNSIPLQDHTLNCEKQNNNDSNHSLKDTEKVHHFYDLWNGVSNSGDPVNLMTFLMDFVQSNGKNNEKSGNEITELPGANSTAKESTTNECNAEPQNKALQDIFAALGLKTASQQVCQRDVGCTSDSIFTELRNAENSEYLSAANFNPLNMTKGECINSASYENVVENGLCTNTTKESMKAAKPEAKSEEQNSSEICNKTEGNEESMEYCKSNEVNPACESLSNTELYCSQTFGVKDIPLSSSDDVYGKNTNDEHIISIKRKYESCFQDIFYSLYKEEIKEIEKDTSIGPYRHTKDQKEIEYLLSKMELNENKIHVREYHKSKWNDDFSLRLNTPNSRFTFSSISYSKHTKNTATVVWNVRNPDDEISNENSNLLSSNKDEIATLNIITSPRCGKIVDGRTNLFDLMIDGMFSDSVQTSSKRKQKSKYTLISCTLSIKEVQIPEIKLHNLQKLISLYQRLILCKIIERKQISVKISKPHTLLSKSELVCSPVKNITISQNNSLNLDCCHERNGKIEGSLAIQKDYNTLLRFKSEFSKLISAAFLPSTKIFRKQSKPDIRSGIRASKIKDKERRRANFMKSNDINSERNGDTKIIPFKSQNGYKPQFINCESRSRWYKVLHRIESCIPLASLLLDYTEQDPFFNDCTTYELICSTGKIIFSSKEEHILRQGEYGTCLGLMSNGNPVVIRKFPKSAKEAIEFLSKKRRISHKNIAVFYCVCDSPIDQKIFAVTELIEYSLPEYLKTKTIHFDGKLLVQELVEAMHFLHRKRIVHGFLKPSNVMVTIDHRLKVSGFYQLDVTPLYHGVVRSQDYTSAIGSRLSDFCWRPYELVAAGTEMEARRWLTTASDIQMTGMIMYYILSGGKHPFGSSDLLCQENIRSGHPEFGPRPSDIESRDLVRDMIRKVPSSRLSIDVVAKHPYLWNILRRFQFLVAVSRKIDFFIGKPTKISEALQDSCLEARDWTCYVHSKLLRYVSKAMDKAYVNHYADLLHFVVGINDHFDVMPPEMKSFMEHPALFISRTFPTIFMSVYCVMRDNPYVQQQMALQSYF